LKHFKKLATIYQRSRSQKKIFKVKKRIALIQSISVINYNMIGPFLTSLR